MIVFLGFSVAGYLINSSYSDLQDSPVSTSITIHPIAELDFPTVTVCPPKGVNTALNYDLIKADNNSLTKKERETLIKETHKLFIKPTHSEFVINMLAAANLENMKEVLNGLQSVPMPYAGNNGFEVRMWNNNGTWHTPSFRGECNKSCYKEDKYFTLVLELPEDLPEKIGSGSLIIHLEVDITEERGRREEVAYWEGSKYKLYKEEKTWADAEAHCQREGGHLASVQTERDLEELKAAAGTWRAWMGGTDQHQEGIWRWSDDSPWGFTDWEIGHGNRGDSKNCAWLDFGYGWSDVECQYTYSFICQSPPDRIFNGNTFQTLNFTREQLSFTYNLYKLHKTWDDAEAHCQAEGGHLASIRTDEQEMEVMTLTGGLNVWLGGTDSEQEGNWRWADGTAMGYTQWRQGFGKRGYENNCVAMLENGDWGDFACTTTLYFVCQSPPVVFSKANTSQNLGISKEHLTFKCIRFRYHYIANPLLDALQTERVTGFQLSWFLQNSHVSDQNTTVTWKPKYQEQHLVRMAEMTKLARIQRINAEEVNNRAFNEKTALIWSEKLLYTSMCSGGQIRPKYYNLLEGITFGLNIETGDVAKDEDILTGFMMFSTMIYCSEPVALSQFLHNLLSTKSPRTIIQATVNTIQSSHIRETINRKRFNEFYLALDKIFHFQLGKALLASVSTSELKNMQARDWPYFTHYSQELEDCLNMDRCQEIRDIVNTLGKFYLKKSMLEY